MDLGIAGRVAIVTGASAGIGYAVADELLANGASVLVVARNQSRLNQAAEKLLGRKGAKVASLAADVAKPESAELIVGKSIEAFGGLHILVNNAGRAHAGGLMNSSEEDWEEMTGVKLTSMRRMCKAAIPHMQKAGWGRIVNMSSIGGIYPNPKLFVSHVLSAAINNLTKSLAMEVAKDGILVNAIGIGAVATDNWANNMVPAVRRARQEFSTLSDDEVIARISAELTPVGRAGTAQEIAAIAAFLSSDRNGFVTGDTIEASGGADRFM
ncbi:SDR family NAD(P)-dependent oxidoreductase [Bradyrhizobium neotropicale]|uniref:SDR family NAD(P)-dependent oxidoreductase n=1 Tax=Bradyrhizobium neotropicale TaxID=1497615 RepID=UPI001AD7B7B4|nr:SDR family oxidoreductase [Bradyrhizobium neotropicale]MBO4224077.1 SDR family oxidoreductase [Bradyrhizobium neotropicale]